MVSALSLVMTFGLAAYVALVAREAAWHVLLVLLTGLAVSYALFGITRTGLRGQMVDVTELNQARQALIKHAERLRILQEIDRALIAEEAPEAIGAAVIQPLRELLGVSRAIVNMFDLAAGEVEWLAAAGRRRTRVGPGVRYSMRLMGDVDALRRGEPQVIDTHSLPPGPEVDALLASGVHVYMVMPMIAGGELIGALSFGGAPGPFPAEQVDIAQEAAMQLAIAIAQARLRDRVRRQADELELRVRERTQELHMAHAELKKSNAELMESATELQAANKGLESFSYSISHDLRAPLRAIDGYALMLEEDYRDRLDGEAVRYLSVIRGSSKRMGTLIDDLLAFAKLGRQAIVKGHLNMDQLVDEAIEEARGEQNDKAASIELGPLPAARGDRALLRQVWVNLISNALKYSSQSSSPVIQVRGQRNSTENIYSVCDNGVGFDMRYYHKLFGVFQRLHRADEFSGTGVGLAIVQRVVTRHGGRVWAEGKVNEGSTFYFALPIGEQDE